MTDSRLSFADVINSLRNGRRDSSDYETLIFLQNNYIELLNDQPEEIARAIIDFEKFLKKDEHYKTLKPLMKYYFLRIVTEFIIFYELPESHPEFSVFIMKFLYAQTKIESFEQRCVKEICILSLAQLEEQFPKFVSKSKEVSMKHLQESSRSERTHMSYAYKLLDLTLLKNSAQELQFIKKPDDDSPVSQASSMTTMSTTSKITKQLHTQVLSILQEASQYSVYVRFLLFNEIKTNIDVMNINWTLIKPHFMDLLHTRGIFNLFCVLICARYFITEIDESFLKRIVGRLISYINEADNTLEAEKILLCFLLSKLREFLNLDKFSVSEYLADSRSPFLLWPFEDFLVHRAKIASFCALSEYKLNSELVINIMNNYQNVKNFDILSDYSFYFFNLCFYFLLNSPFEENINAINIWLQELIQSRPIFSDVIVNLLTELHNLWVANSDPRTIEDVPTLTTEQIFENISKGMIGLLKKLEPAENMKYYYDLMFFMIVKKKDREMIDCLERISRVESFNSRCEENYIVNKNNLYLVKCFCENESLLIDTEKRILAILEHTYEHNEDISIRENALFLMKMLQNTTKDYLTSFLQQEEIQTKRTVSVPAQDKVVVNLSEDDFLSLFRLEKASLNQLSSSNSTNLRPYYILVESEEYNKGTSTDFDMEDNVDALIEGTDLDSILTANDLKCLESGSTSINENFTNLREFEQWNCLKYISLLQALEAQNPTASLIKGEEVKRLLGDKSSLFLSAAPEKLRAVRKTIEKVLLNDVGRKEKMLKTIVMPLAFRKPLGQEQKPDSFNYLYCVKLNLAQSEAIQSDLLEVPVLDLTRIQQDEELLIYPHLRIDRALPCEIDMFLSFLSEDRTLHYGKVGSLKLHFKDFFYPLDLPEEGRRRIIDTIKELNIEGLNNLSQPEYEILTSVAVFNYYWQDLEFETIKTLDQKPQTALEVIEDSFKTYFLHEIYSCSPVEIETEKKIIDMLFPINPRRMPLNQELRDNPLGNVVRMIVFVPPSTIVAFYAQIQEEYTLIRIKTNTPDTLQFFDSLFTDIFAQSKS